MATTTVPLIRANLVTLIEGLTPTRLTEHPFRRGDRRTTFPEWVSKNSGKVRAFDIQSISNGNELEFLHPTQVERDEPFSIMVAYPRLVGLAGGNDLDSLRDMIREDARVIRDAVFDSSNYLSGELLRSPPVASFSEDGEVWFAVFDFTVKFYEAQSL